jgi:hypothetical protein
MNASNNSVLRPQPVSISERREVGTSYEFLTRVPLITGSQSFLGSILLPLVATLFILGIAAPARGCPMCNMHNYLAFSVRSSSDIYVATVLKPVAENRAQLRVLRVLRGSARPGDLRTTDLWDAKRDVGNTLIFCNPTSRQPNWDSLPVELEAEINWLLATVRMAPGEAAASRSPYRPGQAMTFEDMTLGSIPYSPELTLKAESESVTNFEACVQRIQDTGNEGRRAGLAWLEAQTSFPSANLMTAVRSAREAHSTNQVFAAYRLDCLVEALTIAPTSEAEQFLLGEVDWCIKNLGGVRNRKPGPWIQYWPCEYMVTLANCTTNSWRPALYVGAGAGPRPNLGELRRKITERLLTAALTLDEPGRAQVLLILSETSLIASSQLAAMANTDAQKDAVAYGLYERNQSKVGFFSNDNRGLPEMELAATLAKSKDLRAWIKTSLQEGRDFEKSEKERAKAAAKQKAAAEKAAK